MTAYQKALVAEGFSLIAKIERLLESVDNRLLR